MIFSKNYSVNNRRIKIVFSIKTNKNKIKNLMYLQTNKSKNYYVNLKANSKEYILMMIKVNQKHIIKIKEVRVQLIGLIL